ncbi:MAG: hypothetical protein LBD78_00995 [Spirochaetaceae bacterium]|nr:hypothetical protein [Spirochaetaceae bacterium]
MSRGDELELTRLLNALGLTVHPTSSTPSPSVPRRSWPSWNTLTPSVKRQKLLRALNAELVL